MIEFETPLEDFKSRPGMVVHELSHLVYYPEGMLDLISVLHKADSQFSFRSTIV